MIFNVSGFKFSICGVVDNNIFIYLKVEKQYTEWEKINKNKNSKIN